ncbi:MAG: MFS transporter [Canibacter sp.]
MGIYRDLSQSTGVFRIIFAQLLARLPFGMLALAMLLHIELVYGNYTAAGAVLAAQSIGQALSGPVTSRWMGRWGMRNVLLLTTAVCAVALTTIALLPLPLLVIVGLAFLVGFSTPPVSPAVRTIYPKMVPGKLLSGLYSLDASAQEIIWVLGPVVAVFVSTHFTPAAGLLTCVAFMVIGGIWFVLSPEVRQVRIPLARRKLGAVLRRPTVVISTIVGFLFVASFAAIEAGIVSIYGHEGIEGGIVLAVFAGGSLIGGLLFAHRALAPWSLVIRMTTIVAGTALCLVSLDMRWLCLVLLFGGLGTAPTFASLSALISSTVKFSETAEAFGWSVTGQLMGAAAGSAAAGIAVDHFGPRGAILASLIFVVLAMIAGAVGVKQIPDLRGRDATPIPDTEPVQTPPEAIS